MYVICLKDSIMTIFSFDELTPHMININKYKYKYNIELKYKSCSSEFNYYEIKWQL